MIAEAIKNLVHNALRYGAGESDEVLLEIHLVRRSDRFVLSLCDRGPGVPHKVLPELGQRFPPAPAHREVRDWGSRSRNR